MDRARLRRQGAPALDPRSRELLGAFAVGSIAQGLPLVVVAAAMEGNGASGAWLAALAVARLAPYLVCSPFAGLVVGRRPPERVLVATLMVRAAGLVTFAAALQLDVPPIVFVGLLFALVAAGTPAYPAVMRAVHDSVAHDDVVVGSHRSRTDTRAAGVEALSFWIGPALGGLLVGLPSMLLLVPAAGLFAASARLSRNPVERAAEAVGAVVPGAAIAIVGPADAAGVDGGRSARGRVGRTHVTATAPSRRFGSDRTHRIGLASGRDRSTVWSAVGAVLVANVLAGVLGVLMVRLPTARGFGDADTAGVLALAQGVGAAVAFVLLLGRASDLRRPGTAVVLGAAALVVLGRADALGPSVLACFAFGAAVLVAEVGASVAITRCLPGTQVATGIGLLDSAMVLAMTTGVGLAPLLEAGVGPSGALVVAGLVVVWTVALGRLAAGPLRRTRPQDAWRHQLRRQPAVVVSPSVSSGYSGRSPVARAVEPVSL